MGTVNKFGTARLLDPANADLNGQARVNAEIFSAVEILGRKLERSEAERDRLARRLALFESAASIDEKTGKLYLPMVMNPAGAPRAQEYAAPKWMVSASLMSSAIALFSLGLVLFRTPAPALTQEHLAVLESLRASQFASVAPESKGWTYPAEEKEEVAAAAPTVYAPYNMPAEPQLPPVTELQPSPATELQSPVAIEQQVSPDAAELAAAAELARLEQAEPAEAVAAVAEETADITEDLRPETVLIPGEDKLAEKPLPIAAAAAEKAPAPKPAVKIETAAVVPAENAPDPDPALPAKLANLEKRAYEGIPEAQHDLATLYASGKLVAQDYPRTIYWFTRAAEGGVANAHYNLGVIHHQGMGVTADMGQALGWYEKAAELGHPEAMYNLGIAYIEGVGTKANIDRGVSYFKRAAKAGVAQAAYNLGVLYESNFIGPIDLAKASEWYQMAASEGHTEAGTALTRIADASSISKDQALTLAEMVEPAAGEEYGQGDSSPVNEILAGIQQELIRRGLLPGDADGVMSPQTEDAIRAYQKKLGLKQDGLPSQKLLDKIQASAAK